MRILMLAQSYPPVAGNEESTVQNLCLDLVRRGHKVAVATLWQPGLEFEEVERGVKIYRVRDTMQMRRGPAQSLRELHQIILREKPDLVYARNWYCAP